MNSKMKKKEKKEENLTKITNTFLKAGAEKELNLPATLRKEFLTAFENKGSGDTSDIFDDVEELVKKDLEVDNFTRFIRTKECMNFLKKNMDNTDIMIPESRKLFKYTEKDFQTWESTEKDVNFIDYLEKDSYEWEMAYSVGKVKGFYGFCKSILPDMPEAEKFGILKVQIILDEDIEKVANVVFPVEGIIKGFHVNQLLKEDEKENEERISFISFHVHNAISTGSELFKKFNLKSVCASSIKLEYNDNKVPNSISYYSKYVTDEENQDLASQVKVKKMKINVGGKEKKQFNIVMEQVYNV